MIEFVQVLHMPGHKDKKREESPPPHVKSLQTIQETKKSLPIYPFKKDLIRAIKDHQVSGKWIRTLNNKQYKIQGTSCICISGFNCRRRNRLRKDNADSTISVRIWIYGRW